MLETQLEQAAGWIQKSTYAVALTGAGISTPSGVPDFRSHSSGLWENANPMEVASLQGFRYKPAAFYAWIRPLAQHILHAEPNPAHYALARLETRGKLRAIVTQNIDLLHTRAGSQHVYEIHGHIREMTCVQCYSVFPAEAMMKAFLADSTQELLYCPKCQGVLKPNVILFGEQLPIPTMIQAQRVVRQADFMLVVGSSLEVFPAADLPRQVKARGGKVVLVNLGETYYDSEADLVIRGDCAAVLPRMVDLVEGI